MRTGRLTRMPDRIGLDRLEPLQAMCPDWGCLGKEDIQEWRSVWWCIYRLDSYSSLSFGTPYLIDNSFINTSLLLDARRPNGEATLPPGWFNPRRNAFTNESPPEHHARLITVFHLHMARLLSAIVACSRTQDDGWIASWQQVLETCQDIAQIAGQWNSYFCIQVDPAICFVIFTALIFLDLHMKSVGMASLELLSHIDHDKTALCLQLDHFARIWTLPRLLSLSFAGFSESVSGSPSHSQITLILSRFEAPLHPRWLGFLSTAQANLAAFQ